MSRVRVLEQGQTGIWHEFEASWSDILQRPELPPASFIFESSRLLATLANVRQDISRRLQLPSYLISEVCSQSNGFFWCDNLIDDGTPHGHNIYFRLLVKHASQSIKSNGGYVWYEMGFLTHWITSNHLVVVCFDVPSVFQIRLFSALQSCIRSTEHTNPYFFQTLIVDEIISLYDKSIWGLRDHIRGLEKGRLMNRAPEPDYFVLHEIARHAIHAVETLNVAVDTVTAMHDQYRKFLERQNQLDGMATSSSSTQTHMQFQVHLLRNLWCRSQANEKRIHNEISFAYNIVAQRDSQVLVRVGKATRSDSAVMRIVAIVTMTFLPATFLSALFSMSFFNFRPETDTYPETWSVSSKIWIYWAFAVPLTGFTVGTWFTWHRFGRFPPNPFSHN